jgi:hypothetical protein
MPSEAYETTIVGRWLKALGADKYTKAFFEQGYEELDELTKDHRKMSPRTISEQSWF